MYTLLLGALMSWLISAFFAQTQTREQFKQLVRPAMRRVAAARESVDGLLDAIDRRKRETAGDGEAFRSLRELVEQHARVLDGAILDWREVIPEDVAAAEGVVRNATMDEARFAAIADRMEQVEARASEISAENPSDEVAALRREVAQMKAEAKGSARLRSPVQAWPLSLAPAAAAGCWTSARRTSSVLWSPRQSAELPVCRFRHPVSSTAMSGRFSLAPS